MAQRDDEIDLLALLLALLRGWKTILAFTLLGLLLGITYSRYVQPTFQTDGLIQIDSQSKGISALGSNISELVGTESSPAEAERELIKSRMVLHPVVKKLHLDLKLSNPNISTFDRILLNRVPTQNNTEQGVSLKTSAGEVKVSSFDVPLPYLDRPFSLTRTSTGFKLSRTLNEEVIEYTGKLGVLTTLSTPDGDINIKVDSLPSEGHTTYITKLSKPTAINKLNNALSVQERGKQTGILELVLVGEDQQQISRVLSNVINSYVDQSLARGTKQTSSTLEFMEVQIPQLKQKLEQSEAHFNKFREQNGTIDVTQEASILIAESSEIEKQISELNLKKAELLTYYTEEHPLVIQINEQLSTLQERKNHIREGISRLPEMQREFLQLSQDMEINREIYLTMLKNYQQLQIAQAGEIGYVHVVDMPINTYQPIAPKKALIWTIVSLLGFMLGALLVLIRSLLRNPVKDPESLEAKTGVPVLATIPRSKSSYNLSKRKTNNCQLLAIVGHDSLSYEAIKSLRTSLMFAMPNATKAAKGTIQADTLIKHQGKVIMITGEAPGIGKSFISSNLAETFSQLNKKVLIIDGDMRRGELHQIFTVDRRAGLANYLGSADASIDSCIHPTSFDLIDFMPRGENAVNPPSLLAGKKFADMMAQLVQVYDIIIIDTPSVLAVSDSQIIAEFADKVLMVTRYNKSIEGQVVYAVKQLNKSGIHVDGIIINDMVQGIASKYNYNYSYAYKDSKD